VLLARSDVSGVELKHRRINVISISARAVEYRGIHGRIGVVVDLKLRIRSNSRMML
jgi:hypothetical protein